MTDRTPKFALNVLDALVTGAACLESDGSITYLNPAAESLLGCSLQQARGQVLAQLFQQQAAASQALQRACENDRMHIERDLHPQQRDMGTPAVIDARFIPLPDGTVLVELSDALERVRMTRENASATQRGVSRAIVSQLAHEIKNPLGGLRGAAQLLERHLPREELRRYTDVILREADRLTALVDTMLGPGGAPQRRGTNIYELLDHVLQLVSAETGDGIRFVQDYDPSLPLVFVDADELTQALLNLARNAAQAMAGEGRLTLRTRALTRTGADPRRKPLAVQVDIEDDGPGVPVELAQTLFYPLVSGRSDGTGLGLALAQQLIRRQDGEIEYQSQPGRTIFSVFLIGMNGAPEPSGQPGQPDDDGGATGSGNADEH